MTIPEMVEMLRGDGSNDAKHPPYSSSLLVLMENSTVSSQLPNATDRDSDPESSAGEEVRRRWGVLGLLMIILCSIVGNLLVCLAVCWERRLQNMTNYFLMSLAIADLLVSVVVMPLGMIVELFGE